LSAADGPVSNLLRLCDDREMNNMIFYITPLSE